MSKGDATSKRDATMIIAQNRWFSRGGNYKWKGESGKLKVALSLFASLLLVSTAFAEYTCELSFPHAPATALADFPVLKNIPRRGIRLVQSAAGINAANVKFEDVKPNKCGFFFKDADGNEYTDAAAIEAAGKTPDEIKEIWYRNFRGGFSVIVL